MLNETWKTGHGSWLAWKLNGSIFGCDFYTVCQILDYNIVMHSLEQIQNWFEGKTIVQMCNSLMSYDNIWHPSVMIFIIVLLPAFTFWTEFHRRNKSTLVEDKLFIQIKNWSWRPTKKVCEIFLDSLIC